MKIITHNPYRILGVMSNARIKDIEKNKSLLKAFSAVNKSADFKSDLTALLGPVVRDQNAMSDAESSLSIPADKLRYALFWFIATNDDEKNDIATLTPDNIHLTIDRWAATPGFVATHNRVVALLCANRYEDAVKAAKKEYAEYLSDLKSLFDPDGLLAIDEIMLVELFIQVLDEEGHGAAVVTNNSDTLWRKTIHDNTAEDLKNVVQSEIKRIKEIKGESIMDMLFTVETSIDNAKATLDKLKPMLTDENRIEYDMLSDTLCVEAQEIIIYIEDHCDDPWICLECHYLISKICRLATDAETKRRTNKNVKYFSQHKCKIPHYYSFLLLWSDIEHWMALCDKSVDYSFEKVSVNLSQIQTLMRDSQIVKERLACRAMTPFIKKLDQEADMMYKWWSEICNQSQWNKVGEFKSYLQCLESRCAMYCGQVSDAYFINNVIMPVKRRLTKVYALVDEKFGDIPAQDTTSSLMQTSDIVEQPFPSGNVTSDNTRQQQFEEKVNRSGAKTVKTCCSTLVYAWMILASLLLILGIVKNC